ncbi:hypothetical protein B0H10DRAFT_2059011 [Mycena sp. CBHHK59/15]|nr:hypothetical protein B0H10DRAFT_2059011 [Mycena sp. CBHHK59/15]
MRKRYSSSFPHRYAAGSSVGSGGSGESGSAGAGGSGSASLAARERTASGAGAGAGSRSGSFVTQVGPGGGRAARRDLVVCQGHRRGAAAAGRYRLEQQQQQQQRGGAPDPDRDADPPSSSSSSPGTSRSGTVRGSSSTVAPAARAPSGAMLTSESEVDERLRRMNEEFMRSLVGLGGGGGGDGQGSQEVIGRLEFDFDGHGRG